MVVMNHTGGASLPSSSPVTIDDVLALGCDIIGHANGGTTSLPDDALPLLFEAPGAIQLVQAGNLRSSLAILALAVERDALDRIVFATDTPTGTGVMPLGMLKTVTELASLGHLRARGRDRVRDRQQRRGCSAATRASSRSAVPPTSRSCRPRSAASQRPRWRRSSGATCRA